MNDSRKRSEPAHRITALETVLALGGSALLLVLLWSLQSTLNPLVLGTATIILLWPLRGHRTVVSVIVTVVFLLLIWLFVTTGQVLAPFIVVYLVAYLLEPGVNYLEQKLRFRRWISAIIMTLLLVAIIVLVSSILVPRLVQQLQLLASGIIDIARRAPDWVAQSAFVDRLEAMGLVERATLREELPTFLTDHVSVLLERIPHVIRSSFASLNTVLGWMIVVAIVPIMLFYTIRDFPLINSRLVSLLPTVGGDRPYLDKVNRVVGNYLRGQLIISSIAAFNVGFWLTVFDVPFSLLIGVLAGILNLIPQIGALMTNLVATILVLAFGDPILVHLLVVQIVLLGQSLLEQSILTPKIMSMQLGLHPLLVILVILLFGRFLGLLGLLIAVPVTALLVMLWQATKSNLEFDLKRYGQPPEEA